MTSFVERAGEAFEPLTTTALALPGEARAWLAGELSDEEYRSKLEAALADATETRDRVAALPHAPGRDLYLVSAELYVAHVRVHLASMAVSGDQRTQTALLARRMRELADRIFDRGHVLVDPSSAPPRDVELRLPEEVPDWIAEGMAPGPPLEPVAPPPPSSPPLREASRPTEAEATWLAAVERAGAPGHVDLDGDLAAQARAFVAAAEALRHEPDPDVDGGRERSATLRLAWLVQADAARAAQLGLRDVAIDVLGALEPVLPS